VRVVRADHQDYPGTQVPQVKQERSEVPVQKESKETKERPVSKDFVVNLDQLL